MPLRQVLVDAGHGDHTHFELVISKVHCADGACGVGYTYTGGKGGTAIRALLRDEIAGLLHGANSADIAGLWKKMRQSLHYLGCGGVVGFAISAVDVALWDLHCRRLGQPLWRVAGGHANTVPCYRGLIDLGFSEEQLVEVVAAEIARGHTGIKLKVGRPDYQTDVRRVRRVRDVIGPAAVMMADANYSWDASTAIAFAKEVAGARLHWFEEPVDPHDFDSYAAIAQAVDIPLASGENLRTFAEFREAIRHARLGYLQPDASNLGGITGWLEVARHAALHGLKVASHGMHELHVSLMAAQPNASLLEVHSFPIDEYTHRPFEVANGIATAPEVPGTGVEFDFARLKPYLVHEG
ncbi:uroporphyrinogen decarboxylase [Steroidobacter agaridevorans]|nr:uroporphyrinogen decarboxylase [Steroidobacter agaridevorans]